MIKIDTGIFSSEEIKRIYLNASVPAKVKNRIEKRFSAPAVQDDAKIAEMFLKKLFGPNLDNVPEKGIENYLFCGDLKETILSFWRCVSLIWTEKLQKEGKMAVVTDRYADKLSRWNGVQEHALEKKDIDQRMTLVKEVVTKETLPFFTGITESDITGNDATGTVFDDDDKLKAVGFVYVEDLICSGKEIKGALKILSKVFDYGLLDGAPRHEVLAAMHIPVCPYCNRQYVSSYRDKGKKKITADLDHYYCKSFYPYLALSIYNFVPSCQICNSRFKLARDFYGTPHLYPYEQNPGAEMIFKVADPRLLLDDDAWENVFPVVKLEPTGEAAENSMRMFNLEDVYQSHKDYIHELIWKLKVYNDDRLESIQKDFPTMFADKEDVRTLVFGQSLDEKDAHKRPLAKLTRDILKDCGRLK